MKTEKLIIHSALDWLSLYVNSLGAQCKCIFTYRIKTKHKWIQELNIENLSDIIFAMKSFVTILMSKQMCKSMDKTK